MITAKGNAAKENINKSDLNVKDEYISLKEGAGMKVRLLAADDFVEYHSHGAYNLDIFTQPCPEEGCVYCKAANLGIEEFKALKSKNRYLFAFGDLETGKVKLLDVSKNQAKKLMASIDEYAENINDIAFTLKRVGTGKDTSYTLNPILKMKASEEEQFNVFDGHTVAIEFFVDRLDARVSNEDFKVKMLAKAGLDVSAYRDLFGAELVDKALAASDENAEKIETESNESLI